MMGVLKEIIRKKGIRNITCVEKRWEEVVPEEDLPGLYDRVVCSLSLCMTDLRDAIRKMEQVCRGAVFLYGFKGVPSWDALPLEIWPALHGRPYHPMPRYDVLRNVLDQMGIVPSVRAFPFHSAVRFPSLEEAVDHLGPRYLADSRKQKSRLREYLSQVLEKDANAWVLRHAAECVKVWWEVKGR
jgi:hypothetical protein